jgi:hypothetical protein
MVLLAVALQALLTFTVDATGPVRFGVPLRAAAIERGLALEGAPDTLLQWRRLQEGADPSSGRTWVEIAVGGPAMLRGGRLRLRLTPGQQAPEREAAGLVYARHARESAELGARVTRTMWSWNHGGWVDARERRVFLAQGVVGEETFDAGEALTVDTADLTSRWLRVTLPPATWTAAGVLPQGAGIAAEVRGRVLEAARSLQELPGLRGAGDYGRGEDVVTNLEFDTALGLARLGLASGDRALLARAAAAARHLLDRDLDGQSGLPFAHGADHRVSPPEVGHAWLQGMLLVGCLSADDELIAGARSIARAIARRPPLERPRRGERARDFGWPLLELEAWLRFERDQACAVAADRYAAAILARWDEAAGVIRFGEGERRNGAYVDRAWITGGVLVPALRAHALRTGNARALAIAERTEERLVRLLTDGRPGLTVRYLVAGGLVRDQVRHRAVPEAFLVLEGLSVPSLRRVLARGTVQQSLAGVPDGAHPDVATQVSMAARCTWIYR